MMQSSRSSKSSLDAVQKCTPHVRRRDVPELFEAIDQHGGARRGARQRLPLRALHSPRGQLRSLLMALAAADCRLLPPPQGT
jgi:hypothetical protein